jgi:hypothetical protein
MSRVERTVNWEGGQFLGLKGDATGRYDAFCRDSRFARAGHQTGLFEARGVRRGGEGSGKTAVLLTNNRTPAHGIGKTRVLLIL